MGLKAWRLRGRSAEGGVCVCRERACALGSQEEVLHALGRRHDVETAVEEWLAHLPNDDDALEGMQRHTSKASPCSAQRRHLPKDDDALELARHQLRLGRQQMRELLERAHVLRAAEPPTQWEGMRARRPWDETGRRCTGESRDAGRQRAR